MKALYLAAWRFRDIKPQNIIVRGDGSVALIDFGISRVYKKEATSDTVFSGTEGFAPPEQYGFMQTDIRSDIYSFGVVLSWLLTGKEQPIRIPLTKMEEVAAKCCAFAPEKRYKNDDEPLYTMPNLATVEMSAIEQGRMEELIAEYGEPPFQMNYI